MEFDHLQTLDMYIDTKVQHDTMEVHRFTKPMGLKISKLYVPWHPYKISKHDEVYKIML